MVNQFECCFRNRLESIVHLHFQNGVFLPSLSPKHAAIIEFCSNAKFSDVTEKVRAYKLQLLWALLPRVLLFMKLMKRQGPHGLKSLTKNEKCVSMPNDFSGKNCYSSCDIKN